MAVPLLRAGAGCVAVGDVSDGGVFSTSNKFCMAFCCGGGDEGVSVTVAGPVVLTAAVGGARAVAGGATGATGEKLSYILCIKNPGDTYKTRPIIAIPTQRSKLFILKDVHKKMNTSIVPNNN